MKKAFFLSTIALLSLGALAGCGGNNQSTESSSTPGSQSQPASEPASQPASEPASQPASEPASQPASEPASQPASEPASEPASQPASEPASEPAEELNVGEVKIWCDQKILDVTQAQADKFLADHPTYKMSVKLEPKGEGGAAGDMIQDPASGADLYFFAQDQLSRLVTAKAIAKVPASYVSRVTNANDATSVAAGTVGDTLYAYPATSDNTFFMYYNKEAVGDADITDFNALVAKAKATGKKVYFDVENAWYNSAFFYGAGAHSEWEVNTAGDFTDYDDTYNSDAGLKAVKAMRELFGDKTVFVNGSAAGEAFASNAMLVVSGVWDKNDAQKVLGDKFGVATLPNFTVDGENYSMKPFGGYKLVGVKPQTIVDRTKAIHQLAIYLTGEECALGRFEEVGWGPSNLAARENEAIAEDKVLNVVFAQMAKSTPQGQYPGDWWNHEGIIGTEIQGTKSLESILQSYEDGLEDFIS